MIAAWRLLVPMLMLALSSPDGITPPADGSAWQMLSRETDGFRGLMSDPLTRRDSDQQPAESWSALGFRDDGTKLSLGRQHDLDWAKLNSKVSLIAPDSFGNAPLRRNGWQSEDSLKMPLFGSLFLVGQVGANSQSFEWQQYKVSGTTGLGMRLPAGGEIQVRSGRSLTNFDSDDQVLIPEQVKRFVEFSTKWRLPGAMNLEYTGEASRTAYSSAREVLRQDLRLAMPFSNNGQVHVGAKYRWEESANPTPWLDRTKLYFGLELKR